MRFIESIKENKSLIIAVIIGNIIGNTAAYLTKKSLKEEKSDKTAAQSEILSTKPPKRTEKPADTTCGYIVRQTKDTLYVLYPLE